MAWRLPNLPADVMSWSMHLWMQCGPQLKETVGRDDRWPGLAVTAALLDWLWPGGRQGKIDGSSVAVLLDVVGSDVRQVVWVLGGGRTLLPGPACAQLRLPCAPGTIELEHPVR